MPVSTAENHWRIPVLVSHFASMSNSACFVSFGMQTPTTRSVCTEEQGACQYRGRAAICAAVGWRVRWGECTMMTTFRSFLRKSVKRSHDPTGTCYLGHGLGDFADEFLALDVLALAHVHVDLGNLGRTRRAVILERHHCAPTLEMKRYWSASPRHRRRSYICAPLSCLLHKRKSLPDAADKVLGVLWCLGVSWKQFPQKYPSVTSCKSQCYNSGRLMTFPEQFLFFFWCTWDFHLSKFLSRRRSQILTDRFLPWSSERTWMLSTGLVSSMELLNTSFL